MAAGGSQGHKCGPTRPRPAAPGPCRPPTRSLLGTTWPRLPLVHWKRSQSWMWYNQETHFGAGRLWPSLPLPRRCGEAVGISLKHSWALERSGSSGTDSVFLGKRQDKASAAGVEGGGEGTVGPGLGLLYQGPGDPPPPALAQPCNRSLLPASPHGRRQLVILGSAGS